MTVFNLLISSQLLTDVRRRSLYVNLVLFGRTLWVQWWPRPIIDRGSTTRRWFLTWGSR